MAPAGLTGHLASSHWKAEGEGRFQKDPELLPGRQPWQPVDHVGPSRSTLQMQRVLTRTSSSDGECT